MISVRCHCCQSAALIVEDPVESEVVEQLKVVRPEMVEDDKVTSNSKGNKKLRGV